jgi:uncharacterized protein with FMN-binding domain
MKRALLIAGGTVGGLGAVLAITPPQLGSTSAINIAGAPIAGADTTASASASSSTSSKATAAATTKATAAATKNARPVATKSSGTNTVATAPAAQAPATTAPATTAINGTFTGPSVNVNYGNVQVKITVVNGRITDAVAVKAPSGKNDRYTNMAVPTLKAQTLKAQSANIQGVSGASYTSYGWFTSLQGAIALAGL